MNAVLLVLSAPAARARPVLAAARARFAGAPLVVVLRASQEAALRDLLDGAEVWHDKPQGGRRAFLRALRQRRFAHGIVLWTGEFNYWPAKLAFALARVAVREAVTERGTGPGTAPRACVHLLHRLKRPEHPAFGMPAGIPWPLAAVLAAVRATLGRALGVVWLLARAAAR